MSLTVLITNICMDWPSGTVIYARDLALERAVTEIVGVYEQVIEEAGASRTAGAGVGSPGRSTGGRLAVLRYRASKVPLVAFYRAFGLGPRQVPGPVKPVYRVLRAAIRHLLWVR
jgi:hypothetical protein